MKSPEVEAPAAVAAPAAIATPKLAKVKKAASSAGSAGEEEAAEETEPTLPEVRAEKTKHRSQQVSKRPSPKYMTNTFRLEVEIWKNHAISQHCLGFSIESFRCFSF